MNLNKVELIGGVVRPPELRLVGRGYPIASFTLAVNDTKYSPEEKKQVAVTTYLRCEIAGSLAYQIEGDRLRKGEKLYVMGALSQFETETPEGKKDTKTRISIVKYDRLEPPEEGEFSDEPTEEPEEAPF